MTAPRGVAVFALLVTNCAPSGLAFLDCDYDSGEALAVVDAAVESWPDLVEVVDRLDVQCVEHIDAADRYTAGQAVDPGNAMWRGLINIDPRYNPQFLMAWDPTEVCGSALVHELQHFHLWDADAYCHDADCGWDEGLVGSVVAGQGEIEIAAGCPAFP